MYEEILKRDREGRQPIRTIVQQEVVSKPTGYYYRDGTPAMEHTLVVKYDDGRSYRYSGE